MEAFEKSERIRIEQKELIQNIKRDMIKVRKIEERPSETPAPIINLEVAGRQNVGLKSTNTKGFLNI